MKAHFDTNIRMLLFRSIRFIKDLLLGLTIAMSSAALIVSAEAQEMQLGVYVVVEDLANSKSFYQTLLGKEPVIENADFIGYSLAGGLLGIYNAEAFTHELHRGNSAVVYIRVEDIEQEFARVAQLGAKMVHEQIVREPYISLFMFTDPDGNAIEFYALD